MLGILLVILVILLLAVFLLSALDSGGERSEDSSRTATQGSALHAGVNHEWKDIRH